MHAAIWEFATFARATLTILTAFGCIWMHLLHIALAVFRGAIFDVAGATLTACARQVLVALRYPDMPCH